MENLPTAPRSSPHGIPSFAPNALLQTSWMGAFHGSGWLTRRTARSRTPGSIGVMAMFQQLCHRAVAVASSA
jgi:hypothetical protein